MDVGVEVWIRNDALAKDLQHEHHSWLPATVTKKTTESDGKLRLVTQDQQGKEHVFLTTSHNSGESEDLKLRNAHIQSFQTVDNLIDLPHLNEPEVLNGLQHRFMDFRYVYTYTGPVLLAINPMKLIVPDRSCEVLFQQFIQSIKRHAFESLVQLNAIDEEDLLEDGVDEEHHVRHSILISGESGSGKTECAKMLVKYMVSAESVGPMKRSKSIAIEVPKDSLPASNNFYSNEAQMEIVEKLVHASSILESFGNAATVHCANSSRYGQFMNLDFNLQSELIDGTIKTYLLENVRVVNQQQGERNFHIFYQLMAGAQPEQVAAWKLEGKHESALLNKGCVTETKESMQRDQESYEQLVENMRGLGFSADEITQILELVAALVHLGDLKFEAQMINNSEGCVIASSAGEESGINIAARLAMLDAHELATTLTVKTISSRGETFLTPLNTLQASNARDAIVKAIYRKLFDHIALEINCKLNAIRQEHEQLAQKETGKNANRLKLLNKAFASVGILDIFGFDAFEVNSFEQLCINYANEALQQEFNQTMFKLELEEYEREGIKLYESIVFSDNQKIMELISQGIFKVLDDQCKIPNASDKRFASQVYKEFENNHHFVASSAQKVKGHFSIVHFAGTVAYSTEGFTEKNLDELPAEALVLLSHSSNPILSANAIVPTAVGKRKATPSAVTQFKHELGSLVTHVQTTTPHYIRCINPVHRSSFDKRASTKVTAKAEVQFDAKEVADQLRYGGIFEAIRVTKLGYPHKYTHMQFLQRYKSLVVMGDAEMKATNSALLHQLSDENLQALCKNLIDSLAKLHNAALEDKLPASPNKLSFRHYLGLAENAIYRSPLNGHNVQLGHNKVFMKSAEHEIFEFYKSIVASFAVQIIERLFAGYLFRQRHRRAELKRLEAVRKRVQQESAVKMQALVRGFLARLHFALRVEAALKEQMRLKEKKAQEVQVDTKTPVKTLVPSSMSPKPVPLSPKSANVAAFPEELREIVTAARSARKSRNLSTKVQEYKQRDERLLQEINMLITSKRQSDEICLLRFDISKAKTLVLNWSNLYTGVLKEKVAGLAKSLEYGYELLLPEKLIPQSTIGKALTFGRQSTSKSGVKHANKSITADHKVFKNIYKLLEKIKELMEIAHMERLAIEDRQKKAIQHGQNLMSEADVAISTGNITKVMDFCRILYQYYSQYIQHVVREMGDGSPYKESFPDDNDYLTALTTLIEAKQPLLSIEKQQIVSPFHRATTRTQNMETLFPTTISLFSLPLLPPPSHMYNSSAYNAMRGERSVVFKYIRYAPGIEYAVNSLFTLLHREALMYPIRLIKLVGKSAANYGQVAYYQAAMHFSEETLMSILDPEVERQLSGHGPFVPSSLPTNFQLNIDSMSYSIAILCSLLCNAIHFGEAENFMIMRPQNNNNGVAKIVGVNNTKLFCDQMFQYTSPSESIYSPKSKKKGNILFALPQVHNQIDPELKAALLQSCCFVEEILSSWLRELYLQNKRYESLVTSGFTVQDLVSLTVPILLPPGAVVRMYSTFKEIISLITSQPNLTHAQLISRIYPQVQIPRLESLYQHSASFLLRRQSMKSMRIANSSNGNSPTGAGASFNNTLGDIPTVVAEEGEDSDDEDEPEITVYNSSFYSKNTMLEKFQSSIEDVAVEFLTNIDFCNFFLHTHNPDVETVEYQTIALYTCGVISDNLSFLPSLWLRNVNEDQLKVMFGGLIELAYRYQNENPNKPSPYSSKLFTKHIFLLDRSQANRDRLANSVVVQKIEHLVGIKVTFMSEDIFATEQSHS